MKVIIGVDPHKATHQAVAVDDREVELAQISVRASPNPDATVAGVGEAVHRTGRGRSRAPMGWATCCPSSSSLPARRVVDVPATLAARTRVLASGRSNKTDPNDARSVAVTALRHDAICVECARSVTAKCCGCWRSATPTSVTSDADWLSRCTRCWSSSLRAGSPRKSTLLTSIAFLAGVTPTTPS